MAEPKPVIFLYPLSETLIKLKDVLSEDEDVDIYEVGPIPEAITYSQTVFPALWITSGVKKCLVYMSKNHINMRKMNSKILVLSRKRIPYKINKKLEAVHVQNVLFEPMSPKSLLFKVQLLLRSLQPPKDQEEDEENDKIDSGNSAQTEVQAPELKLEKMISFDDQEQDKEGPPHKEENTLNIQMDLETEKKSNHNSLSLFDDDVDKKNHELNGDSSLNLDDLLKSDRQSDLSLDLQQDKEKQGTTDPLAIEEEEKNHSPNSNQLNLTDPGLSHSQSQSNLSLFDEQPDVPQNKSEGLLVDEDTKRGEATSQLQVEEGEKKSSSSSSLSLVDSDILEELSKSSDELEITDEESSPKSSELEITDEESSSSAQKSDGLEIEEGKKDSGSGLSLEIAQETDKKENGSLSSLQVEDDSFDGTQKKSELEIEEERGKKDEISNLAIEEEEGKRPESDNQLKIENQAQRDKEGGLELEIEEEDLGKKEKGDSLEIEDQDFPAKKKESEKEQSVEKEKTDLGLDLEIEEEERDSSKNTSKLDIVMEEEPADAPEVPLETGQETSHQTSSDLSLFGEEESASQVKKDQLQVTTEDHDQKKSNSQLSVEESASHESKKSNSLEIEDVDMADRKARERPINQEWEAIKKEVKENLDWMPPPKKQEILLGIENKKWGEQGLDYEEIKKSLKDLGEDYRSQSELKNVSIETSSLNRDKKEGTRVEEEEQQQEYAKTTASSQQQSESEGPVFDPSLRDLEVMIEISRFYQEMNLDDFEKKEDSSHQLSQKDWLKKRKKEKMLAIFEALARNFYQHGATMTLLNAEKDFQELYNSYTQLIPTLEPNRPSAVGQIIWDNLKKTELKRWSEVKLPQWSDPHFQSSTQEFIYPYFDGPQRLGLMVARYSTAITQDQSKIEESLAETARGIFLHLNSAESELASLNKDDQMGMTFFAKALNTLRAPARSTLNFFKKIPSFIKEALTP